MPISDDRSLLSQFAIDRGEIGPIVVWSLNSDRLHLAFKGATIVAVPL